MSIELLPKRSNQTQNQNHDARRMFQVKKLRGTIVYIVFRRVFFVFSLSSLLVSLPLPLSLQRT